MWKPFRSYWTSLASVCSGGLVKGYVAEKSGIPLSALLCNNQIWEKDHCGKVDCNPCRGGTTKQLSCRKVSRGGMVYSCCCLTCRQAVDVKESWYAQLHLPGRVPTFQFQAEKFFPDATSAQIYEGVSINHSPSAEGYLMNSKAEYQQGEVARVVLVRGLAQ